MRAHLHHGLLAAGVARQHGGGPFLAFEVKVPHRFSGLYGANDSRVDGLRVDGARDGPRGLKTAPKQVCNVETRGMLETIAVID